MSGGGAFSYGQSKSKSRTNDYQAEEYKDLRSTVSDALGSGISGSSTMTLSGIPNYSGKVTADMTGDESYLLSLLQNSATSDSSLTSNAKGLASDTISGKYLSADSNPYLQSAISAAIRPVTETYQQETLPTLRSNFTRNGQYIQGEGSSPFARELTQATNDYQNTIADTASEMAYSNYSAERDRQQTASDQAQSWDEQDFEQLKSALEESALPRLIEQYGLDQGVELYNTQLESLITLLQTASQATQPALGTKSDAKSWNVYMEGNGGSGTGSSSDIRLKRDIVPLGVSLRGLPLYEYRYVWGGPRVFGVMAHEVARVKPAAVTWHGGFARVKYNLLVA